MTKEHQFIYMMGKAYQDKNYYDYTNNDNHSTNNDNHPTNNDDHPTGNDNPPTDDDDNPPSVFP